jgi:Xaa-Pro aminopeptidase
MSSENLLMIADSVRDADMLYATGLFVPDPFIFLQNKGKNYVVMSDLEFDRAKREVAGAKVISLKKLETRIRKAGEVPSLARAARLLLKEKRISSIVVPHQFPHGFAEFLSDEGVRIRTRGAGACFPERARKTDAEIRKTRDALRVTEEGIRAGFQALRDAKIAKNKRLTLGGAAFTSERLRGIIDGRILELGGLAADTIVACGNQGCDPHERGSGPLRAHQTIIIDVFPRMQKTGYHGDITRTVVKGKASADIRGLFEAVHEAQSAAIKNIAAGKPGRIAHLAVESVYRERGYKTRRVGGRMSGFFHGTGHGLGLEIHEAPRVSARAEEPLEAGNVVTVEPGLYYHGIGGMRLEDVVVVTDRGCRNLVKIEKFLEIK